MKHQNYLALFGLGIVLLGNPSCSKDDDDDKGPTPVTPVDNPEEQPADNTVYKYYGAELYSNETFKYGRFEAKMKMAYAPGCISSMFLYYNDSYKGGGKRWNEIDIEVIGKDSTSFQSNIISGTKENKVTTESIHKLGTALNTDYHVYVVEWTPTYVLWTVDGKEVRRTAPGTDAKSQVATLVESQSLRFNLWSSKSTAWVGVLDSRKIPIAQYIDYVKVSDYDEETATFVERWTDEFDTFDSSRWGKGNWQMENVMERTSNITVENGILVMRLTKEAVQ